MGILSDDVDEKIAQLINYYVNNEAFGDIQAARISGCRFDLPIVCAEHYLFARSIVADNPLLVPIPGLAAAAFSCYDLAKIFGVKKRVTNCPTSEYAFKHTRWKVHGTAAGMWDAIHPSGPPHRVKPSGGMEGVTIT